MFNLEELEELTRQWSEDRGILKNGKATTQCLKLMSEAGELSLNISKGLDIKDDIGDCLVVLTNLSYLTKMENKITDFKDNTNNDKPLMALLGDLADSIAKDNVSDIHLNIKEVYKFLIKLAGIYKLTIEECWNVAYEDIKDRQGFLNSNGNFIKSTDDNYEKLLSEFKGGN